MVLSSCQIWPLSVLADCLWHAAGFASARSCLRVIVLYSVSARTGWRPVTVVCIVQVVREEDIAEFFEQLQQRKRQKTEQLAMQYYCKWTASVPQPPTLKWTAVAVGLVCRIADSLGAMPQSLLSPVILHCTCTLWCHTKSFPEISCCKSVRFLHFCCIRYYAVKTNPFSHLTRLCPAWQIIDSEIMSFHSCCIMRLCQRYTEHI